MISRVAAGREADARKKNFPRRKKIVARKNLSVYHSRELKRGPPLARLDIGEHAGKKVGRVRR
jgi:hypothetical protein